MTELKKAEQAATNLVDIIDEAIEHVNKAVKLNSQLQSYCMVGNPAWSIHETVDDELHNALTKLGD